VRLNKNINSEVEKLIELLLHPNPVERLSADSEFVCVILKLINVEVVSCPCILRTCIDISLDLGRVENKEIEMLVSESIYCKDNIMHLSKSPPATLTMLAESTISPTEQTVKH
jgi:hypothetical protein